MFRPWARGSVQKCLRRESGFLLIASLMLLSCLTLVGATAYILASTEIKIGGNYRNSRMALRVAMAGAERARELLRQTNAAGSNSGSFSDELAAAVGANGNLDRYAPGGTDDVPFIANGSLNGVSYVVYLTNDPGDGETNTTDTNKKIMITAVAAGANNGRAQVKTVVSIFPMPLSPAMIYSKGDVRGDGQNLSVNGNDQCGQANALPPVYTMEDARFTGQHPNLSGSTNQPVDHGSLNLDIANTVQMLSTVATTTLIADQTNVTFGSSSNYQVVYSWPNDPNYPNSNGLTLNNVTGYGILVVKGDLNLSGNFNWSGIIIATGSVTLNGGGSGGINIAGQIMSGTSDGTGLTINGANQLDYNSCHANKAVAGLPLKVMNWKQVDY